MPANFARLPSLLLMSLLFPAIDVRAVLNKKNGAGELVFYQIPYQSAELILMSRFDIQLQLLLYHT